jgi:hypothetical protein
MRLWIMVTVLCVAVGAPSAHATTYTATFTCSDTCISVPTVTDNPVSFPSPTLDFTWNTNMLDLVLGSPDLPTDTYIWIACPPTETTQCVTSTPLPPGWIANMNIFQIYDVSNSLSSFTSLATCPSCVSTTFDCGTLTFTPEAAPEPSSVALLLMGVGLVFAMRKRTGQHLPQAS